MAFTTHFELHSQTTRLGEKRIAVPRRLQVTHGILTLHDAPFQETLTWSEADNVS